MDTPYASGATGFPGEGGRGSAGSSSTSSSTSSTSSATSADASGSIMEGVETQRLLTDEHLKQAYGGSGRSDTGGADLRQDLSRMKDELDALMARASTLSDRELGRARDQLLARFSSMRHAAQGMASDAREQWGRGVDVTSDYVREKPLQSVAIAAGAGMLISLLFGRD